MKCNYGLVSWAGTAAAATLGWEQTVGGSCGRAQHTLGLWQHLAWNAVITHFWMTVTLCIRLFLPVLARLCGRTCEVFYSQKTGIVVDFNDRGASLCGQTDSRSATKAVRLMNKIPRHGLRVFDKRKSMCARKCEWASNRLPDMTTNVSLRASEERGSPGAGKSPWLKLCHCNPTHPLP